MPESILNYLLLLLPLLVLLVPLECHGLGGNLPTQVFLGIAGINWRIVELNDTGEFSSWPRLIPEGMGMNQAE